MPKDPAYRLTLELTVRPIGEGPPVMIRLRRLLKGLLRGHGMQCVGIEEVARTDVARKGSVAVSAKQKEPASTAVDAGPSSTITCKDS